MYVCCMYHSYSDTNQQLTISNPQNWPLYVPSFLLINVFLGGGGGGNVRQKIHVEKVVSLRAATPTTFTNPLLRNLLSFHSFTGAFQRVEATGNKKLWWTNSNIFIVPKMWQSNFFLTYLGYRQSPKWQTKRQYTPRPHAGRPLHCYIFYWFQKPKGICVYSK